MGKYQRHLAGGMLVLGLLLVSMAESVFGTSLRFVVTALFIYYLCVCLTPSTIVIPRGAIQYLIFLAGFTFFYYSAGSGNNLIIHLLTICVGVVFLYFVMLTLRFDIASTWRRIQKFWIFILLTLVVELFISIAGYQGLLFDIFPQANRAFGLPAYRSIYNTFGSYFNLGFDGLNSISLQVQAYGQFCVMLTILGFSYSFATFQKRNLARCFWFIILPLGLYSASPNITAGVIFIFILGYVLFVKYYIGQYSATKFIFLIGLAASVISFYYLAGLGFVRSYGSDELYDLFVGRQIEYMITRAPADYILGVGLDEYYEVAPDFEIAYLSYLSVSGLVFGLVNLVVLFQFAYHSIRQIRFISFTSPGDSIVEIQAANLLFVLSMFLSSIHFPVITSYLGCAIFIFHLSFGMYILNINKIPSRRDEDTLSHEQ